MSEGKGQDQEQPTPAKETPSPADPGAASREAAAPDAGPKAAGSAPAAAAPKPAASPAASPAKPEAPSLTPSQMITPPVRIFLEAKLRSGEQVTVDVKKEVFTGRIFRLMLHEGWIALEHVDGRRRPIWVIEGGKVTSSSGEEIQLPSGHGK